MRSILQSQQGFLAIAAVVIIAIFGVIGLIATYLINTDILGGANQLDAEQALYIAEAGLEGATHQLRINTIASTTSCTTITGNANLTHFTFTGAKGPFTVTGSKTSVTTASTLSGAITSNATTIPLASTASYATAGRIMIDREFIDYLTVSGNNLLNVRRGVDGTLASAHASGAPAGQYQCNLSSQAGVPSLSPAGNVVGGRRIANEVVQLPEVWAVGAITNGSNTNFILWNNPTELTWNNFNLSNNKAINNVSALSYVDAWAVGQQGVVFHWNGNAWAAGTSNTNSNLNGVDCVANNHCWAVGAGRTFDLWNGSTWTVQTSTVSTLPGGAYNSVSCTATNNCWAVAASSNGDVFVHWDGSNWTRDASRPTPAQNLNDVMCVDANHCWAVGAKGAVAFWNGSTWTAQTSAVFPSVSLNGVYCAATNDCWIVGNVSGGVSTLLHWNGSIWTKDTSSGTTVKLNDVSCYNKNNCWAVGNTATTLHWDGSTWVSIANPVGNITLNGVSAIGADTQPASAWQEIFP